MLNWLVYEPKLDAVRAGKLSVVRPVQLLKAKARTPLPKLERLVKLTEAKLEQPLKAEEKGELPLMLARLLKSIEDKLVQL